MILNVEDHLNIVLGIVLTLSGIYVVLIVYILTNRKDLRKRHQDRIKEVSKYLKLLEAEFWSKLQETTISIYEKIIPNDVKNISQIRKKFIKSFEQEKESLKDAFGVVAKQTSELMKLRDSVNRPRELIDEIHAKEKKLCNAQLTLATLFLLVAIAILISFFLIDPKDGPAPFFLGFFVLFIPFAVCYDLFKESEELKEEWTSLIKSFEIKEEF